MTVHAVLFGPLFGLAVGSVVACAFVAAGVTSFSADAVGFFATVGAAWVVGCVCGASTARLVGRSAPPVAVVVRCSMIAGVLATFACFLLRHDAGWWVGLNEIGAGAAPMGQLVVAVLPAAGAVGGMAALAALSSCLA